MSAILIYFDCEGPLDGYEVPESWARWSMHERCRWLIEKRLAEDLIHATEILKKAGEWHDGRPRFTGYLNH